jgi:hypothetical protein
MVLGEELDKDKLQWRIFGILLNGIGFINKGKEVAEFFRGTILLKEKRKLEINLKRSSPL